MAVRKIWNRIVPALLFCMLLSACGNGGGKTGFNVTPPDSNSPESSLNVESAAPETKALEEPSSSVPASRPPTLGSDSPNTPVTDTTGESAEGDVLEIGEKMFLTQISDMYCNFDHYKDKTIIVEGMYAQFYSWDGSETAPVVYRNGPGCCGNDGWGGFLLK